MFFHFKAIYRRKNDDSTLLNSELFLAVRRIKKKINHHLLEFWYALRENVFVKVVEIVLSKTTKRRFPLFHKRSISFDSFGKYKDCIFHYLICSCF